MASDVEVQIFIDDHHRRCVDALQRIAALGDRDSKEFKQAFGKYRGQYLGWRVARKMRETALAALEES